MNTRDTASDTTAPSPAVFLEDLRRKLTAHLAQTLTLSLFVEGREAELRAEIVRVVAAKLQTDGIVLKEDVQARLIDDLISGLPKRNTIRPPQPAAANPSQWDVDTLRTHVAPYIAEHLGNHLFEPGREAQLAEAVYMLVQEKIRVDHIEAGEPLRRALLEKICGSMGIPLPSALDPQVASPVKSPTPPPPRSVVPAPAAGASESAAETRRIATAPVDWVPLDPELRREILLFMGSRLKPHILSSGHPDAAQIHVAELLGAAVREFRVRLDETEREEILATILSGEGLEFQL